MRKEFAVKSIDAAPDGKPYVTVSLMSTKDIWDEPGQETFAGSKVMGITNMNDMMKDINKMLSGGGFSMSSGMTQIKFDMREYREMNLAVGDRVYLDIEKAESPGV